MRKVGLGLLAGIVVVAVVAAATWWVAVPRHRPSLREGESYGIDVSHHQASVDWARVAGDDVRFAYLKATEGGDHLDSGFVERWRAASAAGLRVGAYHFFTLCRPGADQAAHFLSTLRSVGALEPSARMLPPVVDLELAGNCKARPPRDDLLRELRTFVAAVEEATGKRTVNYQGRDWEGRFETRDDLGRPLWTFRPFRRPDPPRDLAIWQVGGFFHVDGIAGRVDLNVADVARLDALEAPG